MLIRHRASSPQPWPCGLVGLQVRGLLESGLLPPIRKFVRRYNVSKLIYKKVKSINKLQTVFDKSFYLKNPYIYPPSLISPSDVDPRHCPMSTKCHLPTHVWFHHWGLLSQLKPVTGKCIGCSNCLWRHPARADWCWPPLYLFSMLTLSCYL